MAYRDSGLGGEDFPPNRDPAGAGAAIPEEDEDLLIEPLLTPTVTPAVTPAPSPAPSPELFLGPLFVTPAVTPAPSPVPSPAPTPPPPPMAANAARAPTVPVPRYSGLPKGASFQSASGQTVEIFTASEWIRELIFAGGSVDWTDDVLAKQAQRLILPGTPAADWLHLNNEVLDLNDWATFRAELVKQFEPPLDSSERVAILRSFKMKPNERATDYLVRLRLGYRRFMSDYTMVATQVQAEREYGNRVYASVLDHHIAAFFLLGLRDDLLLAATQSGETDVAGILRVATRHELAKAQSAKPHRLASLVADSGEEQSLDAVVAAAVSRALSNRGGGSKSDKAGASGSSNPPKPPKDPSKLWCFFCFEQGHASPKCPERKRYRDQGDWRPCISDAPMTKDQFVALDKVERQRGSRHTPVGPISALAQPQAPPAPSAPPAPPAPQAGISLGRPSEEDLWRNYRQPKNGGF